MATEATAETVASGAYTYLAVLLIAAAIWLCLGPPLDRSSMPSKILPAWVPWEIGISIALLQSKSVASYLVFILRRHKGSLFGVSSRHQMLYNLPGVDRILAKGHHVIEHHPLGLSINLRVFGVPLSPALRQQFAALNKPLTAALERAFVNEAAATGAIQRADVPQKVAALLSFSDAGPRHQRRWEWAASVKVVVPERPGQPGVAELDLAALLKDLGACISIPLLYGQDFLDRNPTLLQDFWKFDSHAFPLLVAGAPTWTPIRSFKDGLAARGRLHDALTAYHRRLQQFQKGEPVDYDADMSDLSAVVLERYDVLERFDISIPDRGKLELGTLWGQNANTQPLIFWFLIYIYSTPGLLDALRSEVAECMTLSTALEVPQITEVHVPALGRDCPLLKSALFETFRMVNEPTSIRYVVQPMTVEDGEHHHDLRAGTWISAHHAAQQHDPSIYPEPQKFVPDRFLEVDETTGQKVPRYGRLRPWGAGVGICKGRTFAEKEILVLVACFITLWDMKPGGGGGAWEVPGRLPGVGVMRPREAIRVLITRRHFR